jgi:hypothetical protein
MLLTKKKFQKLLNNNNQSMRKFKKKKNKKPSDSAHTQRRYPKYMTRHNLSVKRRGLVKRYPDKVGGATVGGATVGGATVGGATKGGAGWFGSSDKEEDMFNQIEKDVKKLVSVNENLTIFKDNIVKEIIDYKPPTLKTHTMDNDAYNGEKGRLETLKSENATKKDQLDTKTTELKQQHESAKELQLNEESERQNAKTIARKKEEQTRSAAENDAATEGNALLEKTIQSTKDTTKANAIEAEAAIAREAEDSTNRAKQKKQTEEEEKAEKIAAIEEVQQCEVALDEKATSESVSTEPNTATAIVPVPPMPVPVQGMTAEALKVLQCKAVDAVAQIKNKDMKGFVSTSGEDKAFQKDMTIVYGDNKINLTRINVYGDGSCFYYATIMGLLLNQIDSEPVKTFLKKIEIKDEMFNNGGDNTVIRCNSDVRKVLSDYMIGQGVSEMESGRAASQSGFAEDSEIKNMAKLLKLCINVYSLIDTKIVLSKFNEDGQVIEDVNCNRTISLYNTGGTSNVSHYQLLINNETLNATEISCKPSVGGNKVLSGGGVDADIELMQKSYNDSAAVKQLDELKLILGVKDRANKGVVAPAAADTAAIATIKKELKTRLDKYKNAQALGNTYQKMNRIYEQTIGTKSKSIINNDPPCDEKAKDAEADDDAKPEDAKDGADANTEDDNAVKIALDHKIEVSNIEISMGKMEVDQIIQAATDKVANIKEMINSFETFYKKNVASLKISDDKTMDDKTTDSAEDKDLGLIKFESERNMDASIDFFIRYRDELISTYKKIFTLEKPTTKPPEFGTEYTQSAVDKYKASLQKIYDNYSKKYSGDGFEDLNKLLEGNKPSKLPFDNPPTKPTIDSIVKGVNAKFTEMDTLISEKIEKFKVDFTDQLKNIDINEAIFSDATATAATATDEKDKLYNKIVENIKQNMESAIKAFTAFKNNYLANIDEVIDCDIELNNFDKFIEEKTGEKNMDVAREVLDKITISVEPGSYVVEQSQHQNSYSSVLTPRDKMGIELRTEELITKGATDEAARETQQQIIDGLNSDAAFKEGLEADAKKELTKKIMLDIGTKLDASAKTLIDEASTAATTATV